MKKLMPYLMFLLLCGWSFTANAQSNDEPEALDLPGDNLNLYAVLDVFQKSKTLEDFEKSINDESGKINNLDLNNDNNTDYIQVVSEKKGDSFFVVLQVGISQSEKQDVALIEVTKDKNGQTVAQIIGDEELYGKDYIVEPSMSAKVSGTPNPGYQGSNTTIINNNTTNNYNNDYDNGPSISAWPIVMYFFSPLFIPWRSPWYWGFYPPYWRPWRPVFYHNYWGYHRHYYGNNYFRRTVVIRGPGYGIYYSSRRNSSVFVRNNRINGNYRATYNGRTYRKPAPVARPGEINRPSGNRPSVNRPSVNRPTTTRPTTTRPSVNKPSVNRPTTTRPSVNRPSVTRPSVTRPTARPSVPKARPTARPSTRPVGVNRG